MHLKIATLNIKGWGPQNASGVTEKWLRINQVMKEKRIAILAVQEAHLNEERTQALNGLFGKHLFVVHSADPSNETGARGVAFVLNKRIIKKPEYTVKEIIPGRVLLLDLAWMTERRLRLVNTYAPNTAHENAMLWKSLEDAELHGIDMLLGDFNIVEDSLDRLPPRTDKEEATEALQSLKRKWRLSDGWRQTHANQIAFTYQHTNGTTQSRLDRIYATTRIRRDADNWDLEEPGVETDHKLVYVEIADRDAPYVGKGRWVMPQHLLRDEEMMERMKELAKEMAEEIDSITDRTPNRNPQIVYQAFKKKLVQAARERAKIKIPRIQKRLEKLRSDRDGVLARIRQCASTEGTEPNHDELQRSAGILQDRITRLEQRRFETARKTTSMKCKINSETLTKQWIRANYTPPDFEIEAMKELKDGDGPAATDRKKTL
ncbi:Endonuclease/exonuclease/phosphatase [Cubamyces menziesii]|nr:Endonuclease/exonuclease/phosphatase [Cubamyces menziesii]